MVSVSSVANPYMFTGREYDSETGLYYYRARFYKPSIGRFLQTDPIGYADSLNLYQYCLNNPANYIDPYGLKILWKQVAKGVGKTALGSAMVAGSCVLATGTGLTAGLPAAYVGAEGLWAAGTGIRDTINGLRGKDTSKTPNSVAGMVGGIIGGAATQSKEGIEKGVKTGDVAGAVLPAVIVPPATAAEAIAAGLAVTEAVQDKIESDSEKVSKESK